MQPGLVQQAAGHVQSSSMSVTARWRTLEAVIVPIVLALRHPAQGRLILHGVGLPRNPAPVSYGPMVVPPARSGSIAVSCEQR
jgi:hypothetical protein